jgi:hypothetical protein
MKTLRHKLVLMVLAILLACPSQTVFAEPATPQLYLSEVKVKADTTARIAGMPEAHREFIEVTNGTEQPMWNGTLS